MRAHFTSLEWSQLLSDDAPLLTRLRFKFHLTQCEKCAHEWNTAQTERAAFHSSDTDFIATLQKHARAPSKTRAEIQERRFFWPLPALAIAASVAIFVTFTRREPDTLRAKGSDMFLLHAHYNGQQKLLEDECHPGMTLRAQYRTTKRYLMVIGVDSSQTTQLLFPSSGQESQKLNVREGLIDQAWEMDDRPGVERFIAFFSDIPISFSAAKAATLQHQNKTPSLKDVNVIEVKCRKP